MIKSKHIFCAFFIITAVLFFTQPTYAAFKPLPYQNSELGRNSHAYLPMAGITEEQQKRFIQDITPYAIQANETWGIPTSAIIGMAIIESGYGTTQIAHYANNIFGIKAWGYNPPNAWQLKGQPDEDFERAIPVLADYGVDRKVFDETKRRDNWYRLFGSYEEAVNYLAGVLLLNDRYHFALVKYNENVAKGMSLDAASGQYLYDIAEAGYNHLGGEYYKTTISKFIEKWKLSQHDEWFFSDVRGHWAEESIRQLRDLHIISGYTDGTFRPNQHVTKSQFVKMLVLAMDYPLIDSGVTFLDVPNKLWSHPYIETAFSHNLLDTETKYFTPSAFITRGEMAAMSARALSYEPIENQRSFNDYNEMDKNTGLIEAAAKHKLIYGYTDGTFHPKNSLTRAQAAAVITRVLNKK